MLDKGIDPIGCPTPGACSCKPTWLPIVTVPRDGLFLGCIADTTGPSYILLDGAVYWDSIAPDAEPYMPREDARKMTHWTPLPRLPNAEVERTPEGRSASNA